MKAILKKKLQTEEEEICDSLCEDGISGETGSNGYGSAIGGGHK